MSDAFPARLKQLRIKSGLTQAQLAQMLDKGDSTVRMWELGKNQPNHEALTSLARIFKVSTDYLLGQEDVDLPPAGPDTLTAALAQRPMLNELLQLAQQASDEEVETAIRIMKALRKA